MTPTTTTPLHVHVRHRTTDADTLYAAYTRARRDLAGVPGLTGLELLHDTADPDAWLLVMRWSGRAAYETWESSPAHRGYRSPMRPFQDRTHPDGHYTVYEDRAADESEVPAPAPAPTPAR
ncbi:antibiotic biosynthesis monooxygenase family protein [Streptomyces sp. GD-15H]|uniref:antibiotic biosynthesis monooxygenase family protein n=1 Tax=Streptomyces sp. GD-15H TaxID=3129112 RepID=UPI00324D8670